MHTAQERNRRLLWGGLFVLLLIYVLFRTEGFLRGPRLYVDGFEGNPIITEEVLYTLTGEAHNSAFLYLNNRQIFTNREGQWQEELTLLPGYNVVEVYARDRFGRERRREVQIVLDEKQPSSASLREGLSEPQVLEEAEAPIKDDE